jgi:hypothetical protein
METVLTAKYKKKVEMEGLHFTVCGCILEV